MWDAGATVLVPDYGALFLEPHLVAEHFDGELSGEGAVEGCEEEELRQYVVFVGLLIIVDGFFQILDIAMLGELEELVALLVVEEAAKRGRLRALAFVPLESLHILFHLNLVKSGFKR